MTDAYKLPEVWTWEDETGGKFSSINRPTAGAQFERELPIGKHDLQLYSLGTPNGQKVTIMLEELLEHGVQQASYDAHQIEIMNKDQFSSGFVAVNPNSKIPALMDYSTSPATRVFESGSILIYLANKFNSFIPKDHTQHTECINWLFWQMASAPILGGGFGHFFSYAPKHYKYPIDRYTMEVKRQLDVLDKELKTKPYITGNEYSIADMAIFPWYGRLVQNRVYKGAAKFLDAEKYINVIRWADKIATRPAVIRGLEVNKPG